jgi:calcineurin-like phosphoesterase family protein
MAVFFTSDTHFGHVNIIGYCKRPFHDIDDMENNLVRNWNSIVHKTDTVYHLGDFCWQSKADEALRVFNLLNGVKHLVVGNHDPRLVRALPWASVSHALRLKLDHMKLFLCHYRVNGAIEDIVLHGHEHGKTGIKREPGRAPTVDVGVDNMAYYPVAWDVIRQLLREEQN